jgi:hypothetical protein
MASSRLCTIAPLQRMVFWCRVDDLRLVLGQQYMRFRGKLLAPVFIVLVCGYVLNGIYHFQQDSWRDYKAQVPCLWQRFIAKYEPIRPLLPKGETICFFIDESHADANLVPPYGRLFLAQYAISPQLLNFNATSNWVIVDSDCPESVPDIAASDHWTLVADLRNGVKLYRTDIRE